MASIISLLLLQMLYENFRMWANNREMKLMKVSFQLIIPLCGDKYIVYVN